MVAIAGADYARQCVTGEVATAARRRRFRRSQERAPPRRLGRSRVAGGGPWCPAGFWTARECAYESRAAWWEGRGVIDAGRVMEPVVLLDAAGRRRSAATMPGHRRRQPPRNKGMRYPADPPSVEEIVLVMRHAGDRPHGLRLRGLIVVMWRAGLGIGERSR